jgi:hypothetical protein
MFSTFAARDRHGPFSKGVAMLPRFDAVSYLSYWKERATAFRSDDISNLLDNPAFY